MRLLGAEVIPVGTGSRTLKDAINEAFRDWVTNVGTTNYVFGTVAGPHPFPAMVRDFQRVIGDEARAQVLEREGRLPDAVLACVRSEEHTSELQSRQYLVCRLLLEKKNTLLPLFLLLSSRLL